MTATALFVVRLLCRQLLGAFLGVGVAVEVGGRGVEEPFEGFGVPVGGEEGLGVGVEQAGRGRAGAGGVEFRGLEGHHGLVVLAEVHSGACHHDPEFGGLVAGEGAGLVAAAELDRAFRAAEAALAIGHHGQQTRAARHAAGRPQFRQGLGPFARVIRRHTGGFANHGDPARPLSRRAGVLERRFRILVEETGRHHQVTGDGLTVLLVQAQQITADGRIEFARLHIIQDRRLVTSVTAGAAIRAALMVLGVGCSRVIESRWAIGVFEVFLILTVGGSGRFVVAALAPETAGLRFARRAVELVHVRFRIHGVVGRSRLRGLRVIPVVGTSGRVELQVVVEVIGLPLVTALVVTPEPVPLIAPTEAAPIRVAVETASAGTGFTTVLPVVPTPAVLATEATTVVVPPETTAPRTTTLIIPTEPTTPGTTAVIIATEPTPTRATSIVITSEPATTGTTTLVITTEATTPRATAVIIPTESPTPGPTGVVTAESGTTPVLVALEAPAARAATLIIAPETAPAATLIIAAEATPGFVAAIAAPEAEVLVVVIAPEIAARGSAIVAAAEVATIIVAPEATTTLAFIAAIVAAAGVRTVGIAAVAATVVVTTEATTAGTAAFVIAPETASGGAAVVVAAERAAAGVVTVGVAAGGSGRGAVGAAGILAGSAAAERLSIVVLLRHGDPFLCFSSMPGRWAARPRRPGRGPAY